MKIVVLVKEVPDTNGDRRLSVRTGLADRGASEPVLDEICERAVEVALAYADAHAGTEVVALTMAPESAAASVRKALAMGATSAVHVVDAQLRGADLSLTAEVLAAAVRREGADLVIGGNASTDGAGGVVPAMIAEHLGWPQMTGLAAITLSTEAVSGARMSEAGAVRVSASLPAVVSITDAFPEARFPTFAGIMGAKRKPYQVVPVAELGVDPDDFSVPRAIVVSVVERPARAAGVTIVDEGDAGEQLARFLISNRLA